MSLFIIIEHCRGLPVIWRPDSQKLACHERKNMEDSQKYIDDFKIFCRNNRLRLREAGDGLPIAKAIGKFSNDRFYCNFETGSIGLYVTRETQRQFTYLDRKLRKLGCHPHQIGDAEGTYNVEWMNIPPVAKLLKIKKGAAKVKNPSWLKER